MNQQFSYLEAIDPGKNNIIKGLQLVQEKEGYLSSEALETCGEYFDVPEAEVEGVISFYAQFKTEKPGKYQITVCDGTACHIKGSPLITDWISTELELAPGTTDEAGLFSLEEVACLGCCSLAPVLAINGEIHGNLTRKSTLKLIRKCRRMG